MNTIDSKQALHDLKYALVQSRNGICVLTVKNLVPSEYKVLIVAAGATFFYVGGGNDTDSNSSLTLHYNESVQLRSKRPTGCVMKLVGIATAYFQSTQTTQNYPFEVDAAAGQCLISDEEDLAPTLFVSQAAVEAPDPGQLFRLKHPQ
jgi:hypothetical protein